MSAFVYRGGELCAEGRSAAGLADEFGTPLYVYSRRALLDRHGELARAFAEFDPLVCFSVKVNSNLSVLRALAGAGCGFDIVSGGELFRVLRAGGDAGKVCFAGVGKTDAEIDQALRAGIRLFTVESVPELEVISARAGALGVAARAALRVNPNVNANTHAHVTTGTAEVKFGLAPEVAGEVLAAPGRYPGAVLDGLHVHIGSQITEPEPYVAALSRLAPLYERYRSAKVPLEHIDIGGGFGIDYRSGQAKPIVYFASAMAPHLRRIGARLVMEPGRYIAGNSGVLLARVTYVKRTAARRFVIVDAAMNDLIRPALYGAFHAIWPATADGPPPAFGGAAEGLSTADVVGGVCESGDFFGKGIPLPEVARGDLVAIFSAGAYGFTMSSNYNSRPRAAEVLVDGDKVALARKRETYEDLVRGE